MPITFNCNNFVSPSMEMDPRRASVLVIVVIMLSACVAFPAAVFSPNTENTRQINSCTTIDKPGTYELTKNITNGGGTQISKSCIKIQTGDVIFDGKGHSIDGRGNSHTVAIEVNSPKNDESVEVKNVKVTNWHKGVAFRQGEIGQIRNIQASSNVYGISIEKSQLVVTRDNTLEHNLIGMKIADNTIAIHLTGNEFSNNKVDKT